MNIVQLANTLAVSDGGPARNSFELNVTLNSIDGVESQLVWVRGNHKDSVIESYDGSAGSLPVPGPQKIALVSKRAYRQVGFLPFISKVRFADAVIIHGYYLPWILPMAILLRSLNIPFIITPHGSLTRHQRGASKSKKKLYERVAGRLIRRYSSGFVTGSETEAKEVLEVFPASAVFVAGVGTSLTSYAQTVKEWNTPLKLLSLSRISRKKRIDLSIKSLRVLQDLGVDARLEVVGAGDEVLLAELLQLSRDLQLSEFVTFHGEVVGAEKKKMLDEADIYMLPSDDENFGISLAEALAAGLPSIASSNVASSFAIQGLAGRVLDQPTPESLAHSVVEIIAQDATDSSSSAKKCAEESYSWQTVAERWVECLTSVRETAAKK